MLEKLDTHAGQPIVYQLKKLTVVRKCVNFADLNKAQLPPISVDELVDGASRKEILYIYDGCPLWI